tara:strand:- start:1338 stop:2300 length:963 start_codon:yes stop_codon:yes gene_type:complete
MYLQAFGEVIVDALTVNPALESIPSASAILDTSNYTFQAITYGKDSQGFTYHAHSVSTTEGLGNYNGGRLLIQSFEGASVSSYHLSATYNALSATYTSSIPSHPIITDTRLERGPTNVSSLSPNLGHYTNVAIGSADTSGPWNIVGSFPPSGNIGEYLFFDSTGAQIFSGTLSSHYNDNQLADIDGYVTVSETAYTVNTIPAFEGGAYLASSTSTNPGVFNLRARLALGDSVALAAFGGVKHIGVYCLDLKYMLSQGLTPPYAWNALNNTRSYKLVAKYTLYDSLMFHSDVFGISGLEGLLNSTLFTSSGPVYNLSFNLI